MMITKVNFRNVFLIILVSRYFDSLNLYSECLLINSDKLIISIFVTIWHKFYLWPPQVMFLEVIKKRKAKTVSSSTCDGDLE